MNEHEQIRWDFGVLRSLLTIASSESRFALPCLVQALTMEIASGTLTYLEGTKAKVITLAGAYGKPGHMWKSALNRRVKVALARQKNRLYPDLARVIVGCTRYRRHRRGGRTWFDDPPMLREETLKILRSERGRLLPRPASLVFRLSPLTASMARCFMEEELSEDIREQCREIGEAMRPFVARDVQYLKRHRR